MRGVYRIAVCDDNEDCLRDTARMVGEVLRERAVSYEMDLFSGTAELLDAAIRQGREYHILLLDILMEGVDGMDAARKIRETGSDVTIVLISASDRFVIDGYDIRAAKYLLKPVDSSTLGAALFHDIERNFRPKRLVVRNGAEVQSVLVKEIAYAESTLRRRIIHTAGGPVFYRGTLDELQKELPSGSFARCHNSFLVNLDRVEHLRRYEATLRNGERIAISKAFYDRFKQDFLVFLNEEGK